MIELTAQACAKQNISDFRQHRYNLKRVKAAFRFAQLSKKASHKDLMILAHQQYITVASEQIARVGNILPTLMYNKDKIQTFLDHATRQIDQIKRRVIQGETISHEEKVFSLFKTYSRWLSKGKAGVPVELGLAVTLVEDQHNFILNHQIMWKSVDKDIAVEITKDTLDKFSTLRSISFDKGYHSPENQEALRQLVDFVVMPKKGRLSKERQAYEDSEEFIKERRQHSAIESAINCLEHHGLDVCRDYGEVAFARYVALAVVARNVQQLGTILMRQAIKQEKRKRPSQVSDRLAA